MLKIQHKNFNKDRFQQIQNVFYCVQNRIKDAALCKFSLHSNKMIS